jgi:protein-disulfide isomerase
MIRFVENDKDVRFILKEFPVLGEPSLEAHKVSLAFNRLMPEKAAQFHQELLTAEGRKDGAMAMALAVQMGADEATLKAESEKPEIMNAIREAYELADGLGITGTPSYVVGDEVVFGAVGYDQLNTRVANIRECGKAVC